MLLDRICLDCGHPVSFHASQGCTVENDDLSIAAPGTPCGCTAWEVISGERAVELIEETNRNAQREIDEANLTAGEDVESENEIRL